MITTHPFDPAVFLDNQETLQDYLDEAVQTGDPAFITDALGVIARAIGMADIAKQTGLSRETLYRTLSQKGNPNLKTLIAILDALGVELRLGYSKSMKS
ncbi:putative addiction module antidote protein [Salinivibrio sp. PR6]|uniref:addiction module antidote protein n=1 Tax=unclassified Salinivibrio TaxID=2636825 RepID=UPI000984B664|nr:MULTISPECIES: addiction module antidote protein [unclassified Salinivibrio]OOE67219.1 putative addiction module antidote protein [Salinivibrio sp. IB868]OOE77230.1 putative addiction module antidote protein [Salinivibrio sp. IB870]OOE84726.1 putative addiction module antidote protein [Salinivibrio sp. PR6]